MAMEARLELRLSQRLIMTPQLQQAIKLLQLSQMEMTQAMQEELLENPVLQDDGMEAEQEADREEPGEAKNEEDSLPALGPEILSLVESRWDDYFEERASDGRDLGYSRTTEEDEWPSYDQRLSRPVTLTQHLLWQLTDRSIDADLQRIAQVIVGNLDDDGYLRASVEEVAGLAGVAVQEAEEALRVIQDFDPPGVGARSLPECLLIQVAQRGLTGTLMERLIRDHLVALGQRRFQHIAKTLRVPMETVLEAARELADLEPKPARNFTQVDVQVVVPDVYVDKHEGRYRVILCDEGMPRLRINPFYRALLKKRNSLPEQTRTYVEEKLRSALWLIRSIDQRSRTIYRVAESIVRFQEPFFDKGVTYLKPLVLRDVADDVGMHESTISRVTTRKYMHTPRGIFEFKYFFSHGLQGTHGEVSSTTVRDMVRRIVEGEDVARPLSDQRIVEILHGRGIEVARRTVAKYRGELGISAASYRKGYR